jgi:outer membrane protein assembly complex protein YaeT
MSKFIRDFNPKAKKIIFPSGLFLCFFLLLLPFGSILQAQESSPLVAKISVDVNGQPAAQDMRNLVPLKEGEAVSLEKITNSIRQIYKTGLFSDIQVLKEGEQEIHLTFLLTSRLFTRKIIFQGKENVSPKKLKGGLFSLREGSFFSEEKLTKAVEELKEVLEDEGYYHPEIKAFTEKNLKTSSVNVFFEIQSAKRFVIRKIAFDGEVILNEAELKKKMRSREGDFYLPSVLEEDITRLKEIYSSLGYQRAEIWLEARKSDEKQGNIFLSLKIISHQKIEVEIKGAQVPLSLLKPIWEAEVFEEWGLSEGEAKIINTMREKGYLFSSVKSFIQRVDNTMRVVYQVTPGEKFKIEDISFEGLNYLTPSQLKNELGIGEEVAFLSRISGARLFELPAEIELIYKTKGFSQTRVDLNFARHGKAVKALFYVNEGPQERIEKISFEGAQVASPKTLLEQISSFEGGPFFNPNIQKDIEKLENFYLNQGIRGTEIFARIEKVDENLFSVFFTIREGKRVKIERVIITGNVATRKRTILRELRVKEEDYAFYDKIRESKSRLERLGIFTKMSIEEIPLSEERENLVISLREGERNYASLGVGLQTRNEPLTFEVWDIPVRLRGTAEVIRNNILGSAAQLSLVGQASLNEKRAVLSWEQPYFFGIPMQTYLNAFWESEDRDSFSYERKGVSLTGIKSIAKNILLSTTFRWTTTTLFNLQIEESEVDREHSPFSATSLSGSFIWDRRDDPFKPSKGNFFSFVLEQAYPLFEAKSNYLKSFIKYQHFIPLFSRVTFSAISRLGLGGGKLSIPIHERFFAGGSNSFRGERFDELGPKDPVSGRPVGGEALFLLNFELTLPLVSSIKDLSGALFYDKGNVFDMPKHFNLPALQDAVGCGVRYRTPLGPVRFEIGWNLDVPSERRKPLAFITIGNVF